MSDFYTRELIFTENNLGKDGVLVVIFDQPVDGLYKEKFPVIWRTSWCDAKGRGVTRFTYASKFAFLRPLVELDQEVDVVVDNDAYQTLDYQQQTTLRKDNVGNFSFTVPEAHAGYLSAVNGTADTQDIAFGFVHDTMQTPVYYWNPGHFPPSGSVETKFSPVMRAYILEPESPFAEVSQLGLILREPISVPYIFEQDLSQLTEHTRLTISYDSAIDQFKISAQAEHE